MRGAGTMVAVRVAVTGLAAFAGGSAVAGRSSFGGWALGIVVVAAAVVVAVGSGWSVRSRFGAVVAAILAVVGAALAAAGLDRTEGSMAARVLGRDLPPRAAYAVPLAFVLAAIGSAVLAVLWTAPDATTPRRSLRPLRPNWKAVGAGLVAAVVLSVVAAGGAGPVRSLDDQRLESSALEHTLAHPAEQVDHEPGPVRLDEEVWRTDLSEAHAGLVGSAAVPGWDVVLVRQDDGRGEATTSTLVALSASAGSELWRYERHGELDGVTADPASGRVLLVSRDAAIVLSLEEGDELTTTRLPDDLACWRSVGARFGSGTGPAVEVGATAAMTCGKDGNRPAADQRQLVALIEVATGSVVARGESPGDRGDCAYAAASGAVPPVLVRWGVDGADGGCGPPALLAPDPTGEIRQVAEVSPPPGATGEGCRRPEDPCATSALVADGDTIVLGLDWAGGPSEDADASPVLDLVALSTDGDLLWRRTGDDGGGAVVAASGGHVVVRDGTGWRLLALDDGRELARSPDLGGDAQLDSPAAAPVADGEHVYTFTYDVGLVVRSADDLATAATASDVGSSIHEPFVAAGLLVVPRQDDDGHSLVAYGDGPADEP